MATIMAHACISTNEMIYDRFTELFIQIISLCTGIWNVRSPTTLPDGVLNMPRCIVDIGWLPPLYFTAIKCRISRIRHYAIRLLESTSHREGIWDAQISARIAKIIMQIENNGVDVEDGCQFEPHELLSMEILGTEPLPVSGARVSELQVILPDDVDKGVNLRCMQGPYYKERTIHI